MKVKDRMSTEVKVVQLDTSLNEAFRLMKESNIRRLPVQDKGKLVGITTLSDLNQAAPSSATSLSVHELNYLLAKTKIKDILPKKQTVFTVTPDTYIETAAKQYTGLADRFEITLSKSKKSRLVTDYASHPTAIRFDLKYLRRLAPNAKIHALFHPYRYSLMKYHFDNITSVLAKYADRVYIAPFDPCGETCDDPIDSHDFATEINNKNGTAFAANSFEELKNELQKNINDGEQIIAFGASKLFKTAMAAFQKLEETNNPGLPGTLDPGV